jgi:hypothetical protein
MSAPEKVLIPHDDYDFDTIGKFADGRQFMAFGTGAYPGEKRIAPANWKDVKRWIVGIHIFDAEGNHLTSEARLICFAREESQLYTKLDTMFPALLNDYQITPDLYCDIWIKPFRTVIDDIYYEFVYKHEDIDGEIYEQMALYPTDVVFYPPWDDGRYDS